MRHVFVLFCSTLTVESVLLAVLFERVGCERSAVALKW